MAKIGLKNKEMSLSILFLLILVNITMAKNIQEVETGQDGANTSCVKSGDSSFFKEDTANRLIMLAELVKDIDERIAQFQNSKYHSNEGREIRSWEGRDKVKQSQGQSFENSAPMKKKTVFNSVLPKNLVNLALKKKSFATSFHDGNFVHPNAVDGNHDVKSAYASKNSDPNPYFGVDLGQHHKIYIIKLYFRHNAFHHSTNLKIYVSDELKDGSNRDFSDDTFFGTFLGPPVQVEYTFRPKDADYVEGRYVYVTKCPNPNHLDLVEVEVMGV